MRVSIGLGNPHKYQPWVTEIMHVRSQATPRQHLHGKPSATPASPPLATLHLQVTMDSHLLSIFLLKIKKSHGASFLIRSIQRIPQGCQSCLLYRSLSMKSTLMAHWWTRWHRQVYLSIETERLGTREIVPVHTAHR